MEISEGSATETYRFENGQRQRIADMYVTAALQCVIADPWAPILRILQTLELVGPLGHRREIPGLFRGEPTFRATIQGTDIVRRAAARGALNTLPITTAPMPGEMVGHAIPEDDTFIRRRAPEAEGDRPAFAIRLTADQGGKLNGYPHDGEQTDDGSQGHTPEPSDTEVTQTNTRAGGGVRCLGSPYWRPTFRKLFRKRKHSRRSGNVGLSGRIKPA